MSPTTMTWWMPLVASAVVHGALVLAPSPGNRDGGNGPIAVEIRTMRPPPPPSVVPPPPPQRPPRPPVIEHAPRVRRPPPPSAPPPPAAAPAVPVVSTTSVAFAAGATGVSIPATPSATAGEVDLRRAGTPAPVVPSPSERRAAFHAYLSELGGLVARQRRYPEAAARLGQEGVAQVRVRLDRDGSLTCAPRIASSSGFELLDEEAVRMVRRAAPFPALPHGEDQATEITIPVRFQLEE